MHHYRNHPIYVFGLPGSGKLWRSIGMVFDPENPSREIKRLECADVICASSREAEEQALTLCKAWVDGLKPELNTTH